jgi:hypothetical protein
MVAIVPVAIIVSKGLLLLLCLLHALWLLLARDWLYALWALLCLLHALWLLLARDWLYTLWLLLCLPHVLWLLLARDWLYALWLLLCLLCFFIAPALFLLPLLCECGNCGSEKQ